MATPTIEGAIWQFRIRYAMNAQVLLNTFYYRQLAARPSYETIAADFLDAVTDVGGLIDKIKAAVSIECIVDRLEMQPVAPSRFVAIVRSVNQPCDQVGGVPPQNVDQAITRKGVVASRRGVGGLHLPPPQIDEIINGSFTDLQMDRLQAVADKVKETVNVPFATPMFAPVLWNGNALLDYIDIIQAFPQRTVRVMTRRTVGRGI